MKDEAAPKVVLDTNLFVASFFNEESHSRRLFELAEERRILILWSKDVKKEVESVLGSIQRAVGRNGILSELRETVFRPETRVKELPRVEGVSRDASDDKFLACALAGDADLIISADEDLLKLRDFEGIPIVTATEAYDRIKN